MTAPAGNPDPTDEPRTRSDGFYSVHLDEHESGLGRAARAISRQFWLDMVADGGSIVLFGWATWEVLVLFTG